MSTSSLYYDRKEVEKLSFADLYAILNFSREESSRWEDRLNENKEMLSDIDMQYESGVVQYYDHLSDDIHEIFVEKLEKIFEHKVNEE